MFELPHERKWAQGNMKLVGAYVPRQTADYLSLLALYHNKSVSKIIEEMIDKRISTEEPPDAIVRILANRALNEWNKRLQNKKNSHGWKDYDDIRRRWGAFKEELREQLKRRKLQEYQIEQIVSTLQEIAV